jgi:2-keto-3-deoxy-L-rhamnonate aldolase RhmA
MKQNKNTIEKSYTIGSWVQIGNPEFTIMMTASGFEFLVMDIEHGS